MSNHGASGAEEGRAQSSRRAINLPPLREWIPRGFDTGQPSQYFVNRNFPNEKEGVLRESECSDMRSDA